MPEPTTVRLVVFDLAGTTIDYGCQAPVGAFVAAFAGRGVAVTPEEARGPMGLHLKDHIRAMLQTRAVDQKWQAAVGRPWTEDDVEGLIRVAVPLQVEAARRFGLLVPGAQKCLAKLRRRGVKVATTTGYFREAAEACYAALRSQQFEPDFTICADEVPTGRPAPWMVLRAMEALDAYPPAAVVKVGNTIADIKEGCNAGVWSVGVTDTGNEMGLTHAEFSRLNGSERIQARGAVKARLFAAGAHAVVHSVADVPDLLDRIDRKLAAPNARRQPFSGR
ncbi:MAG TPA: phosphonoacetaldehyde hydrolase [Fimbriiglobus sp.]|nr:phosphonoacetaldehyde hydrolase [Fimbriiglobus sp.]